jgi:hypothetical protein
VRLEQRPKKQKKRIYEGIGGREKGDRQSGRSEKGREGVEK